MARIRGSDSVKTKRLLLNAAVRLFAEQGFSDTSFRMIAEECGLSQSSAMYYFPNKKKLIEEVVALVTEHNHQFINRTLLPEDSAVERLNKSILANAVWAVKYRTKAHILVLLLQLAYIDRDFKKIYQRFYEIAGNRTYELALSAQRENDFKADKDPREFSKTVLRLRWGLLTAGLDFRNPEDALVEVNFAWRNLLSVYVSSETVLENLPSKN